MCVVDGAGAAVVVEGGWDVVVVEVVVEVVVDVVVDVPAVDEPVADEPVVVVSPGSPISVVESLTLVVNTDVEVVDVVAM